jgi:hypothetical protein
MSTSFNLKFNGLTFVKPTSILQRLNGYVVDTMDGVYLPPFRTSSAEKTDNPGGNIYKQQYGPRIINLEGTISAETASLYFQKINVLSLATQIMDSDLPIEITRWDDVTKVIYGRVLTPPDPAEIPGESTRAIYRMSFYCSVPFYFDEEEQSGSTTVVSGGGMPVPFPVPGILGGRVA